VRAANTRGPDWKVGSSRRLALAAVVCVLLAACDGCPGGANSSLKVEGATPFVRCLAAEPPKDSVRRAGPITIQSRAGTISLDGLRPPVTIAAFGGPGFAKPPGEASVAAIAAAEPQLLIMLGGLGDTPAAARETVAALAELPVPTLFLAGGRDRHGSVGRALRELDANAAERIIDVTSASAIRIGNDTFVPVAGSLDGHYALHDEACGYTEADLETRELAAAREGSRRWLLAWQAPSEIGDRAVARTEQGLDLGSAPLAVFAGRLAARGGLFAWPTVQVLHSSASRGQRRAAVGVAEPDLRLVVPRLTGPAIERDDGSRVPPGFVLLRLDDAGLTLVSSHATR
jgi:hypothetical protein